MRKFAPLNIVNIETLEKIFIKSSKDVKFYFKGVSNASNQLSNLRTKTSNIAKIGNSWFSLDGEKIKKEKYLIKDLITGEIIESFFIEKIASKIGVSNSVVLRLVKRNIKGRKNFQIKGRYINLFDSKTFFLIEEESGRKFECVTPKTIFIHLGIEFEENLAKAVSAVMRGVHKTVNIKGKIFKLKGNPQPPKEVSLDKQKEKQIKKLNRKIKSRISSSLRLRLKKSNRNKNKKTEEILGCDIDFFKEWIESQFLEGMTWENMGSRRKNGCKSWHIDHIVPCSLFDLTKEDEIFICFHYSNARPLWEEDNLKRPKDGRDLDPSALIAAKRFQTEPLEPYQ